MVCMVSDRGVIWKSRARGYVIMKKKWVAVVAIVLIAAVASLTFAKDDAPEYRGSKKSDKYHYANCRYVKKIKKENIIEFCTVREARDAGYERCKVCKPPVKDGPKKKNGTSGAER